jgi:hypothetical protein
VFVDAPEEGGLLLFADTSGIEVGVEIRLRIVVGRFQALTSLRQNRGIESGNGMPGFGDQLTPAEKLDLLAFLKTL